MSSTDRDSGQSAGPGFSDAEMSFLEVIHTTVVDAIQETSAELEPFDPSNISKYLDTCDYTASINRLA